MQVKVHTLKRAYEMREKDTGGGKGVNNRAPTGQYFLMSVMLG